MIKIIPNNFKFKISSGTIYNANYDFDKHSFLISWIEIYDLKCYYSYDEVKEFLKTGQWNIYEEQMEVKNNG